VSITERSRADRQLHGPGDREVLSIYWRQTAYQGRSRAAADKTTANPGPLREKSRRASSFEALPGVGVRQELASVSRTEAFAMKSVLSLGIMLALLTWGVPDAGARPRICVPACGPTEKCYCTSVPCCLDPPCPCPDIQGGCTCLPLPKKKPPSARPSSTVKQLRPIPGGFKGNRPAGPMSVVPVGPRNPFPSSGPRRGR
jgi:hypothetical protein